MPLAKLPLSESAKALAGAAARRGYQVHLIDGLCDRVLQLEAQVEILKSQLVEESKKEVKPGCQCQETLSSKGSVRHSQSETGMGEEAGRLASESSRFYGRLRDYGLVPIFIKRRDLNNPALAWCLLSDARTESELRSASSFLMNNQSRSQNRESRKVI